MELRNCEQHHRDPAEAVAENHDIVVLIEHLGRLATGHYFTEDAGIGHGGLTVILATPARHPQFPGAIIPSWLTSAPSARSDTRPISRSPKSSLHPSTSSRPTSSARCTSAPR